MRFVYLTHNALGTFAPSARNGAVSHSLFHLKYEASLAHGFLRGILHCSCCYARLVALSAVAVDITVCSVCSYRPMRKLDACGASQSQTFLHLNVHSVDGVLAPVIQVWRELPYQRCKGMLHKGAGGEGPYGGVF